MTDQPTLMRRLPTVAEYQRFRDDAGWDVPCADRCRVALAHSLCGVVAIVDARAVAMARAVGDGAVSIYIQDVVTLRAYRRNGLARRVLGDLIAALQADWPGEATVGLMAATGQEPLYRAFGFEARPTPSPDYRFGAGMNAPLAALATAPRLP